MDLLGNQLHLARNGHSDRYYILPAKIEGGFAYALHDRIASCDFSMTHNLFGKNPKTYLYPWRSNREESDLVLHAHPDTNYRWYDWLANKEGRVLSDANGNCKIHFGKANTGLIYLLEESEAGERRLRSIKDSREKCEKILPLKEGMPEKP
jgi:hypothetical protein